MNVREGGFDGKNATTFVRNERKPLCDNFLVVRNSTG
jgi:hypothetical protein